MIEKAPRSAEPLSYDDALLYCQFLEYDSHRDWRIPTVDEYHALHIFGWHYDDPSAGRGTYRVTPVRSI